MNARDREAFVNRPAWRHSWLTRPWFELDMTAIVGDIVLTVVGIIFVVVALTTWRSQQPIEGGVVTTGHIVSHVAKQSRDADGTSHTVKLPIIEFPDQNQVVHQFEGKMSGFGEEVGDEVSVRYLPSDPSQAQWADQPGKWLWIAFLGFGIVPMGIEAVILALRRSAARRRDGDAGTSATAGSGS